MDYFKGDGEWWLPDNPNRRLLGALNLDEQGLELVLQGVLREREPSPGGRVTMPPPIWKVDPFMHGHTWDGKSYTLLEVGAPTNRRSGTLPGRNIGPG